MAVTAEKGRVNVRYRRDALRAMEGDPAHEKHGTTTGYQYGCRCESCLKAILAYQATRREKPPPEAPIDYTGDIRAGMRRRFDEMYGLNQPWEL